MEFFKVWYTGLLNMFGGFGRESQRLDDASHCSSKLKSINNINLPPTDEEIAAHRSVLDKSRETTNIFPVVSRKDITNNRLEALSARLEEKQA